MPLPIILGLASVATAAFGAKKGYDGYQKHSEANIKVDNAKKIYDEKKSVFDKQEKRTTSYLESLGEKELEIGNEINEFQVLAKKLIEQLNENKQTNIEISLPKHELQKIENYSYTATSVLGTVVGAGGTGVAAGFAVYGGVMALGAASTGTAISSLSGIAATNATLAALGGGSLSAGGLGMAGGTTILGAAVVAPVLAIAGWAYDNHGDEALKNARKVSREVDEAIKKLDGAIKQLDKTGDYVNNIKHVLISIYSQFNRYFDDLKSINTTLQDTNDKNGDVTSELAKFDNEIMIKIGNGYALASIMVNVITTPIFKIKYEETEQIMIGQGDQIMIGEGRRIMIGKEGIPEMDKDIDGSLILNTKELDEQLIKADSEAKEFRFINP